MHATHLTIANRNEARRAVDVLLQPADTVLDIGAGIIPQPYLQARTHIAVDPHRPYLERIRGRGPLLQATWTDAVACIRPGAVDTIFLLDIIEHLEKDEGERLLPATLALARQQVLVFTPLGFMPQHHPDGIDNWGMDGGVWQEHRSGWLPDDFPDWVTIAVPLFHDRDHRGEALGQTYGAFWALWTRGAA